MPFRTTPNLGPDLDYPILLDQAFYEGAGRAIGGGGQVASPQLGITVSGSDGRDYIRVKSTAAITVGATETQLTAPAINVNTVAPGTGGYYLPLTTATTTLTTLPIGTTFWAAKGTAPLS